MTSRETYPKLRKKQSKERILVNRKNLKKRKGKIKLLRRIEGQRLQSQKYHLVHRKSHFCRQSQRNLLGLVPPLGQGLEYDRRKVFVEGKIS